MLEKLTDEQLEARMKFVEQQINSCTDWKSLPSLNYTFQKMLDEQVRRDLAREDAKR